MNKRALSTIFAAFLAVSAFAGEGTLTAIPAPEGAPRTIHEAVQQIRAKARKATVRTMNRSAKLGAVRPNVIEVETADFAFIIPAAGNVQGANGTFFRSDLSIGNFNSSAQNLGVGWMVTGKDNSTAPLSFFSIPANTVVMLNDFVGTQLNQSGLGGLLIIGYDATGKNVDDNAFIDGFSRIWTPAPQPNCSGGTVSQSFPAISLMDSADDFTAFALGLRQDSNFRTNAGVVNLDSVAHTWTITSINTNATTTMTVQPYSLSQGGVPASFAGSDGSLHITFDVSATNFFWSAYASSVDNRTGDGWVSRATQ